VKRRLATIDMDRERFPIDTWRLVETRLGDDDGGLTGTLFAIGNGYLGIEGNRDLFLNTLNWLAQQESLIAIRPKEASDRRLTMTANHVMGVLWMSLLIVPALVIGAGVLAWWRRRER